MGVAPKSSTREWLLGLFGLGSLWKKQQDSNLSEAETFAILLPVACWLRSILESESDGAGPLPSVAKLNRDDKRAGVEAAAAAWSAAKGSDAAAAQEAASKFLAAAFGATPGGPSRPAVAKSLVELLKLLQSGGVAAALAEVTKMASR